MGDEGARTHDEGSASGTAHPAARRPNGGEPGPGWNAGTPQGSSRPHGMHVKVQARKATNRHTGRIGRSISSRHEQATDDSDLTSGREKATDDSE